MNNRAAISLLALGLFPLATLLFVAAAGAQQSVNLSSADDLYGIAKVGTPVTGGGLDGSGDAYAANMLGTSLAWSGETFTFAPPGPASAVSGKVISLPPAKDVSLSLLASAVRGNQVNQTFIVTYTDGTSTSFTQSISDWRTPQGYAGESVALTTAYRVGANGAQVAGVFDVYGYTFPLNSAKTVQSLTLPGNSNIIVLAVNVTPVDGVDSPVLLTPLDNLYGIAQPGSTVTGGGANGFGDAYAANLLGTSLRWSGETFTFAPPGPGSALSGKVIPLPSVKNVSLSLLATGVRGNQTNQTFIVTYTDGTRTSFTQSLSDWYTPQGYPGESIALSTAYRIGPNGAKLSGVFDVYGYTFALNSGKAVQSLTLPNNRNVIVLAVSVTPVDGVGFPVPLTPVENIYGVAQPGSKVTGGGADGFGNAYAANLLGTSLTLSNETFTFAPSGPGSAVSGKVIPLPPGRDVSLSLLASGVRGNQTNQTFIVTYTDGIRTSFTQSLSDWYTPQGYPGESIALSMAYRIGPSGAKLSGVFDVYGYTFALNSDKTVQSLTLPNNHNVIVLAVDVTPVGSLPIPVNLSAADTVFAIAGPNTTFTYGGADGRGDTYAANLLGASLSWSGETFTFAAPGPDSAVSGGSSPPFGPAKSLRLPASRDINLSFLAACVNGGQVNQTFIVTYTDGSTSTFMQSLSDWRAPAHFPGESIALTMPYGFNATGGVERGPFYLYAYTFPLDDTKTVRSLTLPRNSHVIVLALDLTPAVGGTPRAASPTFGPIPGNYAGPQSVRLRDATIGAVIYYTTDGSTPTTSSTRYTSPFSINRSTTINAFAVAPGFTDSAIASDTYMVTGMAQVPNFTLASGIYAPTQRFTLSDTSLDASIYYTTDGSLPNPSSNRYTAPFALPVGAEYFVTAVAVANGAADSFLNSAIYTIPKFPSDVFTNANDFIISHYMADSCTYYRAIGAIPAPANPSDPCAMNPDGSFQGLTMKDWLSSRYMPLQSSESTAVFVNINDLNFVRQHHAVGQQGSSAAYVCNFPGPDFYHDDFDLNNPDSYTAQNQIDAAIQNAQNGVGALPCVAIDYWPSSNTPYMRFLVFNPAGNLAPAVDLDGRGAKQIPNACTACHGIPVGTPGPASAIQPSNGGNYIPYDKSNFVFSSRSGLTPAAQEDNIRQLNRLVFVNGPASQSSGPLYDLLHGWYGSGLQNCIPFACQSQHYYVPPDLANSSTEEYESYTHIYAPLCRSCHIANGVVTPYQHGPNMPVISQQLEPLEPGDMAQLFELGEVCAPAGLIMPNSKVAFDRLWTTHVGPAAAKSLVDLPVLMQNYLFQSGKPCSLKAFPNLLPN